MPTIQTVKVYEDGSGDFTLLKTAVDSFPTKDLVANDIEVFFELSGDIVHTGSFIDLNSWTTDTTRRINFTAKAGEEATGVAGAGAMFSSDTFVMVCRSKNVTFSSFEISSAADKIHTSSQVILESMLLHDFVDRVSSDLGAIANNSILYNIGSSLGSAAQYSENMEHHQCSIQSDLLHGGFGGEIIIRNSPACTNNLLINETMGGNSNWRDTNAGASSYNADKNETAVGSNPQSAANSDFVDYNGQNFNVSPSSPLYTAGAGGTRIGAELGAVAPPAGVTVLGDIANYNYSGVTGTVALAAAITVTGQTGIYNYAAISGDIDLTGEVVVTAFTANYNYSAVDGDIELGTEVIITGQTGNYNYAGFNGVIDLTGQVTIIGQVANYNYGGVEAEITIQGVLIVTGITANYDYNGVNAIITLQGPIGVNPKNIITVRRNSTAIKVKRKSHTIRVI